MTVSICTESCNDQNQSYAGLESGTQCCECISRRCPQGFLCFRDFVVLITYFGLPVCGNVLTDGATGSLAGDCRTPCIGDSSQYCGGNNSLSLYWNSALDLVIKKSKSGGSKKKKKKKKRKGGVPGVSEHPPLPGPRPGPGQGSPGQGTPVQSTTVKSTPTTPPYVNSWTLFFFFKSIYIPGYKP